MNIWEIDSLVTVWRYRVVFAYTVIAFFALLMSVLPEESLVCLFIIGLWKLSSFLKILWVFSNSKWKFLFYWTSPKGLQEVQKEEMENLSSSIFWYKEVSKTNTSQGDMLNLHFWVWWLKIKFLLFRDFEPKFPRTLDWVLKCIYCSTKSCGLDYACLLFHWKTSQIQSSCSCFCGIIVKKVLNVKLKGRLEDRKDNQQNRFIQRENKQVDFFSGKTPEQPKSSKAFIIMALFSLTFQFICWANYNSYSKI